MDDKRILDEISIVLCGEAGQGIETVESLLTKIFKASGFHVFSTKEYMSRVRGGSNSTQIRVSSRSVSAPISKIDILIPLEKKAVNHVKDRIDGESMLIGEKLIFEGLADLEKNFIDIPIFQMAKDIGSMIFSNVVAVGVISGMLDVDRGIVEELISKRFSIKGEDIITKNMTAYDAGFEAGKRLSKNDLDFRIDIKKDDSVKDNLMVNGAQAIGLGAIAGGCNFISSYPMSPSTGVLTFLSSKAKDFGILAEQAEDEISAINMGLGAWYAGARAIVTTSGGGFALMQEGVSLSGMIETPIVVHLAQRPGPATGLPTRTGQEDLNFVLHSGHGEFCRAIFAPGNTKEAFSVTKKAFEIADKYQIPTFILTDQYTMDTYYDVPEFKIGSMSSNLIIKTPSDYKRYELNDSGISPRGIPGYGDGLVHVDSDEHDESGHIIEDLKLREKMVKKRLKRFNELTNDALPPTITGKSKKRFVVCWGSTFESVKEAVQKAVNEEDDLSVVHFSQVYPLSKKGKEILIGADKLVVVEGNATGQFSALIEKEYGIKVDAKILNYDGSQFQADNLAEVLKKNLS